jgi:hypothetical protein
VCQFAAGILISAGGSERWVASCGRRGASLRLGAFCAVLWAAFAGAGSAAAGTTRAGVPLQPSWGLDHIDTFGTNSTQSIQNDTQMHALYNEGLEYNTSGDGLVLSPNVVINNNQQTYLHFGSAEQFFGDHLEIQARGQMGGAINSEELVSKFTPRSFCVEARYQVPNVQGAWPQFWHIGYASPNLTTSEMDVESPISVGGSPNLATNVSLFNHGNPGGSAFGNVTYANPNLLIAANTALYTPGFDFSAAPHYYTTCYDDLAQTITRWVDGVEVYAVSGWAWSGPNPNTVFALAAGNSGGGTFPGTIASPATFSANLDLYSIAYYTPYVGLPTITARAGQFTDIYCNGAVSSCAGSLTGTTKGDTIVLGVNWCSDINCTTTGATISSITDSFGSTCQTAVGADAHAPSNKLSMMIWYCPALANAGSDTFTVTMSASGVYYLNTQVSEYSPIGGDEQVGATLTGTSNINAAYPIITTSGPTTHYNDLIFAVNWGGSGTGVVNGGFFNALNGTDEYAIETAPAPYTAGWKENGGKSMTLAIAAFYPPQPNPNVGVQH